MTTKPLLGPELLRFLEDLARHNDREWFQPNKWRYETQVRDPFLQLITALRPRLARFTPPFEANPKPAGGSMMRIYRDTRFARDKSPYKTAIAAHFRLAGAVAAAPGFYLHIQPGGRSMLAGGVWHPESAALAQIRDAIVADPAKWKRVTTSASFQSALELGGESLTRVPRGYDADHPMAADLKRKDLVFMAHLADRDVLSPVLVDTVIDRYKRALPLMRFLTDALG